jgi:hypothetical protein
MKMFCASVLLLVSAMAFLRAAETQPYPPKKFQDASGWGNNIQRTMRLLATSTAEKHHRAEVGAAGGGRFAAAVSTR